jgi:hypothetical protein
MSESQSDPCFVGSTSDPSRAKPVSLDEYNGLCAALETVVQPKLEQAAIALVISGFQITNINVWGALANLSVRHRRVDIEAWLRFQVHTSFGLLMTSERIFWMHSVRCGDNAASAEPGRLQDLQDGGAVQAITNRFIQRCVAAADSPYPLLP